MPSPGERKHRDRGIREKEAPCLWRRRAEEQLGWGWPDAARRAPESPSAAGCAGHPSRLSQACGGPGQAGDEEQRRLARTGGPKKRQEEPARGGTGEAEAPGAASSRGFLPSGAEHQNGGCAGPRKRSETPPRARAMAAAARGRARLRGRAEAGSGAEVGARAPVFQCSVLASKGAGESPLPHFSARVTQAVPGAPPVGAVSEAGVTPRLPHLLTAQRSLAVAGAL